MDRLSGRDVERTTRRAAIAANRRRDNAELVRRKERWIQGEASRRVPGDVTNPGRKTFAHHVKVHVVEILILHDQTDRALRPFWRIGESTAMTTNGGEREQ